jgi:hypothetical protein
MNKDKYHHALLLNSFVFPGAGYFSIGKKRRGIFVIIAVLYFLIMPIVRYMHTVMTLMSPGKARDVFDPTSYVAFSLSWNMHHKLIIWSLIAIAVLWIFSILDIYLLMREAEKSAEIHNGMQ